MLLGQAVQLAAQKADWKVGIQTWTFHNLTLMETLDKTQQLGMGYAEAFFFQELGAPFPKETYLNYDLSDDDCALLRHEFKKRGIKPIAFGVASYGTNEEWDKFFAFAHKIGAHMEVAIHNHPSPCIYASAEVVEKALKGRSSLMGVCADIGHWKRVGEDPLKNLQKLSGRIKVAHLKDLTDKMEDATWGTGILPVKAFVNELKRQHFNGLISIEYDDFKSDIQEIRNSLEFLRKCSK